MTRTHLPITAAAALALAVPATALADEGEKAAPRTPAADNDDCSGDDCDDDDIVVDCAAEDDDCDADASGRASCNATVAPDVAQGLTGMLLSLGVVGLHLRRRRA
jgi:MYXO-CTERM domain-containing protein